MTAPELRYQIRERLGRGASSEVFAGVTVGEHGFEKRVAIKRLLDAGDETQVETFIEEARLASQLRHPSVVEVLDFGVWDASPFQVLELVDGINLAEVLARAPSGRMPVVLALHVVHEVATALDYVHNAHNNSGDAMRIVHRDINPSNILVAWAGHVKVTDFGIARAFRRRRRTMVGTVKGTVSYMAPEQLRLEDVDVRADIFALGCVLHELVAGASPVDNTRVRMNVVAGDSVPIDAEMPKDVELIIETATQSQKQDRYRDARSLADACFQALHARVRRDPRREMAEWLAPLEDTPSGAEPMVLDVIRTSMAGGVGQLTHVGTPDPQSQPTDPPIGFPVEPAHRGVERRDSHRTEDEFTALEPNTSESRSADDFQFTHNDTPLSHDTVALKPRRKRAPTPDAFPTVIEADDTAYRSGSRPVVRQIDKTHVGKKQSPKVVRNVLVAAALIVCVIGGAFMVRTLLSRPNRVVIAAPTTAWIEQELQRLEQDARVLPADRRASVVASIGDLRRRAAVGASPSERLAIANELAVLQSTIAGAP